MAPWNGPNDRETNSVESERLERRQCDVSRIGRDCNVTSQRVRHELQLHGVARPLEFHGTNTDTDTDTDIRDAPRPIV